MPVRSKTPTLRLERELLRTGIPVLAGMDEVGRGALAGPVSVGVVLVRLDTRTAPSGLRDSKLLSADARTALVPRVRRWAAAHAVGHASPAEIDEFGIIAALRLAGRRALAEIGLEVPRVILDGSHDWLSLPQEALFDNDPGPQYPLLSCEPGVVTKVKADLRCAAVAAASVLAKVERDAMMTELAREYPAYQWQDNKGYSAPAHLEILRELGPCSQHRRSWNVKAWSDDATE